MDNVDLVGRKDLLKFYGELPGFIPMAKPLIYVLAKVLSLPNSPVQKFEALTKPKDECEWNEMKWNDK